MLGFIFGFFFGGVHIHMHAILALWRSEDILFELVLSFHPVTPGKQTQVITLSDLCPYLLPQLCGPSFGNSVLSDLM